MEKLTREEDEKILKEIKERISGVIASGETTPDSWAVTSLQYCIDLIEQLQDENDSLWFMVEEQKKSRWTSEHSAELNKAIQEQLAVLKLMQMRKGEA